MHNKIAYVVIIAAILLAVGIVHKCYKYNSNSKLSAQVSIPTNQQTQATPKAPQIPFFRTNINSTEMTYTEKYMNDKTTFIVVEKEIREGDKYLDTEYWRTNLDGSNPQKLAIPGPHGGTINPIAHEWVYFLVQEKEVFISTKIMAFNLINKKVKYISEEPIRQFIPAIGVPTISPDSETIIYNFGYADKKCELEQRRKKAQEGCPYVSEELSKLKPRTFSYNVNTDKRTELKNISPAFGIMIGVWDETGENFYNEGCSKITNIKSGITYINGLSKDCETRKLTSPHHDKVWSGVPYLKTDKNYQYKGWISNDSVLMSVQDNTSTIHDTHDFLYNVETKEKKLLAPGDTYSSFDF